MVSEPMDLKTAILRGLVDFAENGPRAYRPMARMVMPMVRQAVESACPNDLHNGLVGVHAFLGRVLDRVEAGEDIAGELAAFGS